MYLPNDAIWSAEFPFLVTEFTEHPLFNKHFTISTWPSFAAKWSALSPFCIQHTQKGNIQTQMVKNCKKGREILTAFAVFTSTPVLSSNCKTFSKFPDLAALKYEVAGST